MLQDLTEPEILISMNSSKTKNRFQAGFQQLESGLQKGLLKDSSLFY